jgi:hypothetical protein
MTDDPKIAASNLDFFISAILTPALRQNPETSEFVKTADDFGPVEAAQWGRLGAQIGYLGSAQVHELIASSPEILEASSSLRARKTLTGDYDWLTRYYADEPGFRSFNEELFAPPPNVEGPTRDLLQNSFQTILLLTAENIFDEDSQYFLAGISSENESEWNARRTGSNTAEPGSAMKIGNGFANVWSYWEEMESSSRSINDALVDPRLSEEAGESKDHPLKGVNPDVVHGFTQQVRAILSPRFHLTELVVVERYAALTGEFVNCIRDDTEAWLDARAEVFRQFEQLLSYAGGEDNVREHRDQLWEIFINAGLSRENPMSPRSDQWAQFMSRTPRWRSEQPGAGV